MSNFYRDGAYNRIFTAAENTTPPPSYPADPLGLIPSQSKGGNPHGTALRNAIKATERLKKTWPAVAAMFTTELDARALLTWCFDSSTSGELAAEIIQIAALLAPEETGEAAA